MTSPLTPAVAPLVPKSATKKKRRPGFRPVGARRNSSSTSKKSPAPSKRTTPATKVTKKTAQEGPAISIEATTAAAVAPTHASKTSSQPPSVDANGAPDRNSSLKRTPGVRPKGITVGISKPRAEAAESLLSSSSTPATHRTIPNNETTTTLTAVAAAPRPAPLPTADLEKLLEETPDANRLSSFCSNFRVPRNKAKRDGPHKRPKRPITHHKKETLTSNALAQQQHQLPPNTTSTSSAPAVQLVNGEIVLRESSLVVPGQRRSVEEVEQDFGDNVVEEDAAQLAIVGASYNSFSTKSQHKKGPQRWTVEETEALYQALRQLGTDFGSMETLFAKRTRKQLKRKYQAELIKHGKLVEMALNPKYKTAVDLSVFNVEVDPKAIESAANEKPPPYEPTEEGDDENKEATANQRKAPSRSATAKRPRAPTPEPAPPVEAATPAKRKRTSSKVGTPTPASFWDEAPVGPTPEETGDNQISGDGLPEPSMEDFFHEPEPEDETTADAALKRRGRRTAPSSLLPKAKTATATTAAAPKVTTKRPRFRTRTPRKNM